jgi:hypothetical protein
MNVAKYVARMGLGSARVSRVGDCVLAIADFPSGFFAFGADEIETKVRFGVTPKPARETRALPVSSASTLRRFNV